VLRGPVERPAWSLQRSGRVLGVPKRFVYLLRSQVSGGPYVGLSSDVPRRLAAHNAGQNRSTSRQKPWEVVVSIEFRTEPAAARFERYLKSGSGWAFVRRRLLD
jgi:predicted GIY-YIG superfamily endonuclease